MKTLSVGAIALCFALAACGGSNSNVAVGNDSAPLAQVPAPNGGDWTQTVTLTAEGGYRMGNPDAPAKLVEYASITCPHCREFAEGAGPLSEQYVRSGQVSWEYRPYMLFPSDPGVFTLLRCQGPAAFFRLIEQLYATQNEWAGRLQALPAEEVQRIQALPTAQQHPLWVRAAGVDQFFRQRGMPEARINACLADPANLSALAEATRRGSEVDGVTATPTFFINGERQEAADFRSLEPRLRAAIGG